MSWLRFLNPRYVRRLEKDLAEAIALGNSLANMSKGVAADAKRIHLDNATALRAGHAVMLQASADLRDVRDVLKVITQDMACGRIAEAKVMVDSLLLLLDGGKR